MASESGRGVDPNKVIPRLTSKIADLSVQAVVYEVAIEDLEQEVLQLRRQLTENGIDPSS